MPVRAQVGSTMWVYNKFLRTQTKMRWVCGLCKVWCKDENGFKCHLMHEGHIRKSQQARQGFDGSGFEISAKDKVFAAKFVQFVAQRYLNQKVTAHSIYNEMYPKDAKAHLLLKSTCWGCLGVFVNYLSKIGELDAVREVKGWMVRVRQDRVIEAEEGSSKHWADISDGFVEDGMELGDLSLLARASLPDVGVPRPASAKMRASWDQVKGWKRGPRQSDRASREPSVQVTLDPRGGPDDGGANEHLGTKRNSADLVAFTWQVGKRRKFAEQETGCDSQSNTEHDKPNCISAKV